MNERERFIVSGLVVLMLVTWLGFVLHRSPDFAGSALGGVLAVSGSLMMLFPLLYLFIKRIPSLKKFATRRIPMKQWLTWHIYAGVIGPILVLLHTGHKFESALGIALTGMTLVVVVSGFIGRYLMSFISGELREKRETLAALRRDYDRLAAGESDAVASAGGSPQPWRWRLGAWLMPAASPELARIVRLTESIADLEYAIALNETFKRGFGLWLKFHIVISFVLYGLLGLHVWAAIHFGLRWFS